MRRASALPTVLITLGLVAALAVGGASVLRRFASDARRVTAALADEAEPEALLVGAIAGWDTAGRSDPAVGVTVLAAQDGAARVWITRLDSSTYWLVGERWPPSNTLSNNRLSLSVLVDSAGVRPMPGRAWSLLP